MILLDWFISIAPLLSPHFIVAFLLIQQGRMVGVKPANWVPDKWLGLGLMLVILWPIGLVFCLPLIGGFNGAIISYLWNILTKER